MQRGSKRITQCTPREAWMQLRDEDRDWIAGRLAERGKRYVERSPTLRLAAVDHTELLKDAVQHGLTYMVRWNGVKEWPRQELFWLARKPMIRFLQKERDKLLRRMGAPDPDQELVIEPKHDGEPEADVLRTHEIERIGRPFAEPPTRLPRGLLEAMKTFYERFTRMSTTNRVAVCNGRVARLVEIG